MLRPLIQRKLTIKIYLVTKIRLGDYGGHRNFILMLLKPRMTLFNSILGKHLKYDVLQWALLNFEGDL